MVKLTIVGRVNDGMAISQGPRYVNEENSTNFSTYKQQAEFLLQEISRGALPPSNMTIHLHDHHCFNYIVGNGVCFITLCDSSYPRKLAFHYLQDLQKELEKFDMSLVRKITKPYSFVIFDNIIGSIRRQYVDTRTQANLSKLNTKSKQNFDILTEQMSQIVERRQRSDMLERMMEAQRNVSPVWGSKSLEVIALKWTPITIILIVASVLLWTSLILTDDFILTSF